MTKRFLYRHQFTSMCLAAGRASLAIVLLAAFPLLLLSNDRANAQADRVPRVAQVLIGTPETSASVIKGVLEGLAARGYEEGRNIVFDRRFAGGRTSSYPELFRDLVREKADVLVGAGFPGLEAARTASGGVTPVVGIFCGSDLEYMIENLARPGSNVTGVACLNAELAAKRIELMRDAFPNLRRLGFLYDPSTPGKMRELEQVQTAAERVGMILLPVGASSLDELPKAFYSLRSQGAEALLTSSDLFSFGARAALTELATQYRLPNISVFREFVDAGGLISYGPNLHERSRELGHYIGRVLQGTRPGDVPIDQPTRFELVVNRRAAQKLGIELLPSLLSRADEVIE